MGNFEFSTFPIPTWSSFSALRESTNTSNFSLMSFSLSGPSPALLSLEEPSMPTNCRRIASNSSSPGRRPRHLGEPAPNRGLGVTLPPFGPVLGAFVFFLPRAEYGDSLAFFIVGSLLETCLLSTRTLLFVILL